MKTQINIILYRCDFCNKRYQVKQACEKHEIYYSKNPANEVACSACIHIKEMSELIDIYDRTGSYYCESKTVRYFFCDKLQKRLHPLKAVRKGLLDQYPEQFEESTLFPKECEHLVLI